MIFTRLKEEHEREVAVEERQESASRGH